MQMNKQASAMAKIQGVGDYSNVRGEVLFYQINGAVIVSAIISGFPKNRSSFYGFHIHEGTDCGGTELANTKGHYNPNSQLHPFHSGDLPPLLSCSGSAYSEFKTDRFTVSEVIGRTVVIHSGSDDFRSQPSGDSGEKIACGVIKRICKSCRSGSPSRR